MDEMSMDGTTRLAYIEEMAALRETVTRLQAELVDRGVRRARGEDPEANVPAPDPNYDMEVPF